MKNVLRLIAVVLLVTGASVADDYVPSSNIYAMVEVLSSETNTMIAVPWSGYTPDNSTNVHLFADHLVWPRNLTDGDLLLAVTNVLSTGGTYERKYKSWLLRVTDGVGTWIPAMEVTRDKDGLSRMGNVTPDALDAVGRGTGLWLVRQNPLDNGQPRPFYLHGQYANVGATVVVSGRASGTNSVMVAHPQNKAMNVNDKAMVTWTGVQPGDTLMIPTGSGALDYCEWDGDLWYNSRTVTEEVEMPWGEKMWQQTITKNTVITIPASCAFWCVVRGNHDIKIEFLTVSGD